MSSLKLTPRKPLRLKPRKPIRLQPRTSSKPGCCGRGLSGGAKLVPKK